MRNPFDFFDFFRRNSRPRNLVENGLTYVAGEGGQVIELPFVPRKVSCWFVGSCPNVNANCYYDGQDHVFISWEGSRIMIKWKVSRFREVTWRAEE